MDQSFDGYPHAEIRLDGRRVIRTDVVQDWGLRLQWEVRRNGQVVATPSARLSHVYEHLDTTPGRYDIVLQMWRYRDYLKRPDGEYINSCYVEISNRVSYTI